MNSFSHRPPAILTSAGSIAGSLFPGSAMIRQVDQANQRNHFEPQELSTWFQQRNSDQRTSLRTTATRIVFPHHEYHVRTNAVSTRTRILFLHTTNTMLALMQYPQGLGCFPIPRICGSSATYRSTVPLFESSNQMFYVTQSILRPLSRTCCTWINPLAMRLAFIFATSPSLSVLLVYTRFSPTRFRPKYGCRG